MNIKTVKELDLEYLVNDTTFIPKNSSNRHYRKVQNWITAGGAIDDLTTIEEVEAFDITTTYE